MVLKRAVQVGVLAASGFLAYLGIMGMLVKAGLL
jgi:hypothetical protein